MELPGLALPHLPAPPAKDQKDPKGFRKRSKDPKLTDFVKAYEKIYTIIDPEKGQKSFKGKAVCAVGQKLKDFMAKFNLTDGLHGDLELDELDCHDQRYAYDLETAASICTEPFASFRT